MKRFMHYILPGFLVFTALACSSNSEPEAKNEKKEDESVVVPKFVDVPQGGRGYLVVKVDRDKFDGKVQLEIKGLPEEIKAEKSKIDLEKLDKKKATFILQAQEDVDPKGEYQAQVTVTDEKTRKEFELDGDVLIELRQLQKGKTSPQESSLSFQREEGSKEKIDLKPETPLKVNIQNAHVVVVGDETTQKKREVPILVRNYNIRGFGLAAMSLSVVTVLALVSFCLYRVLSLPPAEEEHLKGPLEIDTKDTENAD